jgi:threonine synthase
VSFAVPTGNFGDAYAGWAARQMGLTVGRILIATNANDILARAFQSGLYARERLIPTSSPAMDIQAASNFERLVFEAMDGDGASARRHFERFEQSGETDLGPDLVRRLAEVFVAGAASQDEADAAMRRSIHEGGLVDPHTAVALAVAERAGELVEAPLVILSTAHPAKFPQAVRAATGQVPAIPPAAVRVGALTERFDRLNADSAEIKDYVRGFANS